MDQMEPWHPQVGPIDCGGGRYRFRVWAPNAEQVDLCLGDPVERVIAMEKTERGYYQALADNVGPGTRYAYRLNGGDARPDPASRSQPSGVHGRSEIPDLRFRWTDAAWPGLPLKDYVIYELHVGTFTPEGTFDGVIQHLDALHTLGVTAIELMPIAQFPGARNWGYDGVDLYAVQHSYGGPPGLKRLVDACHRRGLAVVLDAVYNHLGPEGNYLNEYGPYFTNRYATPWGSAVNFDGPGSDEVRQFFINNALYWFNEFHIDALRLDAVHAMLDFSAATFLEDLSRTVAEHAAMLKRNLILIAESSRNDVRTITPREQHGLGLDAQWNDDFHHALRTLITGDRAGYYMDFGTLDDLAKAYREGFVYSGQYSPFLGRRHGTAAGHLPGERFVVFAQNHDHIGNRMLGERLGQLVSFDCLKLAAGAFLLAPSVPLIFMGEEYAEPAPFLYFIDHSDEALIEAVRNGRREEFASFAWHGEPPDPQDPETFRRSPLDHTLRTEGRHAVLRSFYQELLRLRRSLPALATLDRARMAVIGYQQHRTLLIRRWEGANSVALALNFHDQAQALSVALPAGRWRVLLDSSAPCWQPGAGHSSQEPDQKPSIESRGDVALTLPPASLLILEQEPAPRDAPKENRL